MLNNRRPLPSAQDSHYALIFTALGDQTRLLLIAKLCEGQPLSMSELTQSANMSRQAIAKHLHVLMLAGIVHRAQSGRRHLFEFNPQPFKDVNQYLTHISKQWDQALSRLKSFVEYTP